MKLLAAGVWVATVATACKTDPEAKPTQELTVPHGRIAVTGPRLEFVTAREGEVASLVRVENERASSAGRRLIVYVGASWCEPCRRFHDAAVAGTLDAAYPPLRFLEFDLDRDEKRLADAGYTTKYVPLFAIAAADGRASGKQLEGSIKGPGAAAEITPRLARMLKETSSVAK